MRNVLFRSLLRESYDINCSFWDETTFKDYTTLCNSAPSEFLATLALRHADAIAGRNLAIIRENLDRLDAFFGSHKDRFGWYRPKAGSIAFPALLQGTVNAFCADLVRKTGVLLLPGTLYGRGYRAFRVGYGRRNLPDALASPQHCPDVRGRLRRCRFFLERGSRHRTRP